MMNRKWQKTKLGEVCKIMGGGTPSKSNPSFYNGNILWATVRDMKNDIICDTEFKININAVRNSATNIIPQNNIVIASRVGLGKVCYLKYDTAINQDIKAIIPSNIKKLDVFFLFWWLKSISASIEKAGTGATVKGIKLPFIYNLLIPLPPLSEQKRIVGILDKVFAGIEKAKANTEKNLTNSRELFDSYLQNIFSHPGKDWEKKTLGEVCKYDKTINKYTNLPYIGLEDIESNTGKFLGSKNPKTAKSSTFYFTNEHILYGRLRPYLNKVFLPDFCGHCSTEIFPIKPSSFIYRKFLFYWLLCINTVEKINSTCTGTRMPRANMNKVLNFIIHYPSKEEQEIFVAKLDALSAETRKLEAIYQKKLDDLEELKKSVLQKAFNGEL